MTNSSQFSYKIGDRIECGKFYGTIKYIGYIEGKEHIWLGIEWDDPERGKHDGSFNGISYFQTKHPKSGSFVRPEKVNFGVTILTAIISRYSEQEDEFTAKINQQKQLRLQQDINAPFVEMVGFEKVFNKQSDLKLLKIVNLREQNVKGIGNLTNLKETCPNIEELDVSKNLLSSWLDIFEICQQLKHLNWLNVSENLMTIPENYINYQFPSVKTLICGRMNLDCSDLIKITCCFPNLQEIRAPFNNITQLSTTDGHFQELTLLDLESNKIELWSEICKLSKAENLEHLLIENIGLKCIKFDEFEEKVTIFRNLKKLCISNNLISDWQSISELNRLERLENLKILNNPILKIENKETTNQLIIANLENLKVLNGVEIEPNERRGAEYDYIKKYGLEWLKVKGTPNEAEFLTKHPRYLTLIQKYGEPEESELIEASKILKGSLIKLKISYNGGVIEKKLPPTLTVQKLEMLIQKLFQLSEKPLLIYKSHRHSHIQVHLDDELKEIGRYSVQDGDEIVVEL